MNVDNSSLTASARRTSWIHLLIWLPIALLVLMWSFLAWAGHSLAEWSGRSSRALVGGAGDWHTWIDSLVLPAWMERWMPPQSLEAVKATLTVGAQFVESLAAYTPDLLSWLPGVVIAIWVAGIAFLVLTGVLASAAIRFWRGRPHPTPASAG